MVAAQIECHGEARRCCARCGRRLPNKGHFRSTFRSAFGNVPVRVRRLQACPGCGQYPAAPTFICKSSTAAELRYLNAKLAALLPFGKVADFLNEVLPVTAATNAVTVRNRTRRVGARLLREQAKPAGSALPTESQTLVIGLDGGFVKSSRPLSERNFGITAGKVLGGDGECSRFAFATKEYEHGLRQLCHALEELRVDEKTQITVLSDGDAGLRTVQWEVARGSEHILDWFHVGIRLEHLLDASRAMQNVAPVAHGSESAHDLATRAKRVLWNGQADKTFARQEELRRWPLAEQGPTPEVRNLHRHATDLLKYVRANQDSLPDYSECQREGVPFSTGWVESSSSPNAWPRRSR